MGRNHSWQLKDKEEEIEATVRQTEETDSSKSCKKREII
jgi:hypothetical protein